MSRHHEWATIKPTPHLRDFTFDVGAEIATDDPEGIGERLLDALLADPVALGPATATATATDGTHASAVFTTQEHSEVRALYAAEAAFGRALTTAGVAVLTEPRGVRMDVEEPST